MAVVTPLAGALTLTPSSTRLQKGLQPAVGTLTLTGKVPGLGRIEPLPGRLILTGFPPYMGPFVLESIFDRDDPGSLGNQWQQIYSGLAASTFETDNGRARWFPKGNGTRTVVNRLKGINQRETLAFSGQAAGGTFTLSYGGQTTPPIPYDATAAQVQAALEALASIGVGNVKVTG